MLAAAVGREAVEKQLILQLFWCRVNKAIFGDTAPASETPCFDDDGATPNSRYPVLIYRGRPDTGDDALAETLETLFEDNDWPPQWRGGTRGRPVDIRPGDVLVLPAGTGHCRVAASADFELIGAYPPDQQNWDLCRSDRRDDYAVSHARIADTGMPPRAPVLGGPMA